MASKISRAARQLTEAVPFIFRLMVSGDVDRFERESGAFRKRWGIGEENRR